MSSGDALADGYLRAVGGLAPGGFEQTVGYRVVVEDEAVTVRLEVTEAHLSRYGVGHGGVALTLLDTVGGVAVWHRLRPPRVATINLACQFLDAVEPGPVVATATLDRLGGTVAHTSMALFASEAGTGTLLATAVASYRLFRPR